MMDPEFKDYFRISLRLRHPARDPESISRALNKIPTASRKSAVLPNELSAIPSLWVARLGEGYSPEEYNIALENTILFLEQNSIFVDEFIATHGTAEIVLNHETLWPEHTGDKVLEFYLSPEFLKHLSIHNIGLRVQGWARSDEVKRIRIPSVE
jgi:hypothetical protein